MICETCKLAVSRETVVVGDKMYHPRCLSDFGITCTVCEMPSFDIQEVLEDSSSVFVCRNCVKPREDGNQQEYESKLQEYQDMIFQYKQALLEKEQEFESYKRSFADELMKVKESLSVKIKSMEDKRIELETENERLRLKVEELSTPVSELDNEEEARDDKEEVSRLKKELLDLRLQNNELKGMLNADKENFETSKSSTVRSDGSNSDVFRFWKGKKNQDTNSYESKTLQKEHPDSVHQFKLVSSIRMSKCSVCNEKIVPLTQSFSCNSCDYKCHKNCRDKASVKCSLLPSKSVLIFGGSVQGIVMRENQEHGIPIILFQLITSIEADIKKPNLYLESIASNLKVRYIIGMVNDNSLEPDNYLPLLQESSLGTFILTNLLKEFLRLLIEPIIPVEFIKMMKLKPKKREEMLHDAYKNKLSGLFKKIIEFVMVHFRKVIEFSDENGMTLDVMSKIFAPILTRHVEEDQEVAASTIKYFIEHCPFEN